MNVRELNPEGWDHSGCNSLGLAEVFMTGKALELRKNTRPSANSKLSFFV
jgi:hypothetical protein